MPDLSDPSLPRRLAGELARRWVRMAAPAGVAIPALQSEGGGFGTGPNALAASLFTLPADWAEDPARGRGAIDFCLAMGLGEELAAGWAPPAVKVCSADLRAFEVLTGLHRFTGDLSRGVVEQAPRPRGGQCGAPVRHSGNMVEFLLGGRRHCLDVEDAITDFGLEEDEAGVRLWHESTLSARKSWLRRERVEVGLVRYEYRIAADDPVLRLSVRFRAAQRLRDLRLTTALDELSAFSRVVTGAGGGFRAADAVRDGTATLADGKLDYLAISEAPAEAAILALHLRPVPAEGSPPVVSAKAVGQTGGRLHWLVLRHGSRGDILLGTEVVLREDRLLTFGAELPPEAAFAALRRPTPGGADPSSSEAAGEALEAVAQHFLLAVAGAYPEPPGADRLTVLAAWADRRLAILGEGNSPRELAFALLALDCLHRATGLSRHRARIRELTGRLLELQRPDGAFAMEGAGPTPEGQAAALTALARLLMQEATPPDEELMNALAAALSALRMTTVDARDGRLLDTLAVGGAAATGTAALALLWRALEVVQQAWHRGVAGLPADAARRLPLLRRVVQERLEEALRGDAAAVSPFESEPDPAATVALALALSAPDAAVLGCRATTVLASA
jgi:hypothetical protein